VCYIVTWGHVMLEIVTALIMKLIFTWRVAPVLQKVQTFRRNRLYATFMSTLKMEALLYSEYRCSNLIRNFCNHLVNYMSRRNRYIFHIYIIYVVIHLNKFHVHNIRFDVFTAVTMKSAIFWDINPQFIPHARHITSPLHSPAC
jgi:hypothetical protein